MISIPTPFEDPTNLADWIEFRALTASDQNASAADLKLVLNAVGARDQESSDDTETEQLIAACFHELEDRAKSAGPAYPFNISNGLVTFRGSSASGWAYTFCLLLSLKGADRSEPGKSVAELFEDVADGALRSYVGESRKFGFPRRILPAGFKAALQSVLKELREGDDVTGPPKSKDEKDASVDLIAWRPFLDQRCAQLIVFGQCAAGANWQKKLSELHPEHFWKFYWKRSPAVNPVRAFCTPFRIALDDWYNHATKGGILLDRCRIANLTCTQKAPAEITKWSGRAKKELVKESAFSAKKSKSTKKSSRKLRRVS